MMQLPVNRMKKHASDAVSPRALILVLFVFGMILSACSGPSRSALPEDPAVENSLESRGVGTSYVWVDSSRSVVRTALGEEAFYVGDGGRVVFSSTPENGSVAVYAVESNGRIQLVFVDLTSGTSRELHAGSTPLEYTGAWSPDEQSFAFGYNTPVEGQGRNSIGEGGIMIFSRGEGQVRSVGCSASQAVISWPSDSALFVRNNDNMYGVSPLDCATQRTVDIRKWHHISPSPDGHRIAYILRDLAFNSDTRQYEPDSMLYVVPVGEKGGILVVGDRYRPRNQVWSADSKELAFDVLERVGEEKRVVFIYQLEEDKRLVLTTPADANPSESHPSYYGSSHSVYFLADGERLMKHTINGVESSPFDIRSDIAKPVGVIQIPVLEAVLVELENGATYLYSFLSKDSSLLGYGRAIVPGG